MSDYPNSGAMFVNERMREGKRYPDRKGDVTTTCPGCGMETAWWISGWIKPGRDGKRDWLSLNLKPKEGAAQRPEPKIRAEDVPGAEAAPVPF